MPTIRLKRNSPDFESANEPRTKTHMCEMPGCIDQGEYKAPKHRGLNEYHYFCLDHVREYNKAWNFFDGMSEDEVRAQILKDWYGDRPTWKYRDFVNLEEELFRKTNAYRGENEGEKAKKKDDIPEHLKAAPEMEALAIMGLAPPVTFAEIKVAYKRLVKTFHPDHNREDPQAEERLKEINMAFTLLKVAYASYENLEKTR
ncbi:MAG: J domain-containing protein [Pseudobdellovibrionaceae bacterium]